MTQSQKHESLHMKLMIAIVFVSFASLLFSL